MAAILSAQSQDEVVNACTKQLFKKYTTPQDFAKADLQQLMRDIKTITFAGNKAKNIQEADSCYLYNYLNIMHFLALPKKS